MARAPHSPPIADAPAPVSVGAPEPLAEGYRPYERYHITLRAPDGTALRQTRDVLRAGRVVAVLPIDLARDEVVMIRQFRLPAHFANGKGDLVEIVAGRVEPDEELVHAARRECREEIGVEPSALVELLRFLPTPGIADEEVTLFLGIVDASLVPARAGAPAEHEHLQTMRVAIDDALAALARNTIHNGPLLVALQWLALNRQRLGELARQPVRR